MSASTGLILFTCVLFVITPIAFISADNYNYNYNNHNNNSENNYCTDLKPQTTLDMEQLMGMWNGIEIIQHLNRDYHPISGRVCPVILISDTTTETPSPYEWGGSNGSPYLEREHYGYQNANLRRTRNRGYRRHFWRNMSLLWDEGSFTTEYVLRYDLNKPGLWMSNGPQNSWDPNDEPFTRNASTTVERKYHSFTGHVQVLKAVATHLVLTFCHIQPQNELFTIILSRSMEMNPQELVSVHNLIGRRHLSTYHTQRVCRNHARQLHQESLFVFSLFTIIFIFYYH